MSLFISPETNEITNNVNLFNSVKTIIRKRRNTYPSLIARKDKKYAAGKFDFVDNCNII